MDTNFSLYIFFFFLTFLLLGGCSKSDDQRKFENRALSEPDGITETDDGNAVDENIDPDDWQISPMYQGLITIGTTGDKEYPHPNPLAFNQELTINIYIRTIETLNRIEIRTFEFPSQENFPLATVRENISSPTLESFTLSGSLISGSTGGSQAAGLYRILIYDGQQNLITYGDVRIGTEQE